MLSPEVTIIARITRRVISTLAFLLFLFFGWLKLGGVPIGETVGSISGQIFLKASLVIYYFSWVYGTLNDTNDQELVYVTAPHHGRFPWKGFIICFMLATVFGLLCFVNSAKHFSLILACFLVLNIGGWFYLIKIVGPSAVKKSRVEYTRTRDKENSLKLEIIWDYLAGRWQWYRFLYGSLLVGLIIVLAFSSVPLLLASLYPPIPSDTYLSLSIFFYVITFEGWIWVMRVKSRIAQNTVVYVMKALKNNHLRNTTTSYHNKDITEVKTP